MVIIIIIIVIIIIITYNKKHLICSGSCGSAIWAGPGGFSAGLAWDH